MNSFVCKYTLLIFVLLISTSNAGDFDWFPLSKFYVRIYNSLDGNSDLRVHCKSRDDDLGLQVLHPNQYFEFSFRSNWISTLFFCGMTWNNGEVHWFDIYVNSRDYRECAPNCYWNIKKTGPCHRNYDHSCYDWNKKKI
ncbi:S-protein homolog 4-like [Mercurialis annua]|uniref:S-protein homolog 4-like n=1 Tax=Mercurialis annua TaxID=3986 RepID=UPI00215F9F3D|nr:S-protein homolog 4-like [Mercurialis annua]